MSRQPGRSRSAGAGRWSLRRLMLRGVRRASSAVAVLAVAVATVRTSSTLQGLVMPSFAAVQTSNAGNAAGLAGKEAVVVGGTSGIGMGVAVRLAQAGVAVTIVGRDPTRGAEVVAQMEAASPGAHLNEAHSFVACDCFSMAAVAACTAGITAASASGKLDYLVLSQGMATMQGFTSTTEGLDQKMALHYFSRGARRFSLGCGVLMQCSLCASVLLLAVTFMQLLAPLLERAEKPAGGRVLSVLSAGVHGTYPGWKEDTGLSASSYSLKNAADAAGFYNDLAADAMAREHPTLSFIHAAPGFVNTNWGTELNIVARGLIRCLQPLGASPATCAEYMVAVRAV